METIQPIQMEDASGPVLRLLESVTAEHGAVSGAMKIMAHSPRVLEGYLQFSRALAGGRLGPVLREQIALTVAQANRCEQSLAGHTAVAARLGLTGEDILAIREGRDSNGKTRAVLNFARNLVTRTGEWPIEEVRDAGCDDAEIVDIIALVALNVFENYLNLSARTRLDFTHVQFEGQAA